jgi:hypothetical protein
MKHIKTYRIFEEQSSSGYTVIGVYNHSDKEEAVDKLSEVGMKMIAGNLTNMNMWNSYFRGNKLIILRDPAGKPLTVILPEDFGKKIQYLINENPDVYITDSNNRIITDPVEIKKISQALSDLNLIAKEEDIISHIKANPMDQDLLDSLPRRKEIIQKAGVKDISTIARAMRGGLI